MPASQPLKAAAWMMGAVVSFVAMAVAGREVQVEMNTFELMLYRSAIGFAAVVLILWRSAGGFAQVRSQRPWLHARRNLFHYTGQNLWFFAVHRHPAQPARGARVHQPDLGGAPRPLPPRRDHDARPASPGR